MRRHLTLKAAQITPAIITVGALFASFSIGCSTVDITEQRLVSKPNMVFSESDVFDYSTGFHSIVEPGTAGSGGGQAGGCTSCQ